MSTFVLLAILAGAAAVLAASQSPGDPEDDPPVDADQPNAVARLLGQLNYGTPGAAARARLQLLALGPGIVPQLVAQLERVDDVPAAVKARTQRGIERVLTDFGASGFVALRQAATRVEVDHMAHPAMVRVLAGMGTPGIEQAVRLDPAVRWRFVVPAILQLGGIEVERLTRDLGRFAAEPQSAVAEALAIRAAVRGTVVGNDRVVIEVIASRSGSLRAQAREALDKHWGDEVDACIAAARALNLGPSAAALAEGSSAAAASALVWLCAHEDDDGIAIAARRVRSANWPREAGHSLRACVRLAGARLERVVVEQLRHGRDASAELALTVMPEVDGSRWTQALLHVAGQANAPAAAAAACAALLRSWPEIAPHAVAALSDPEVSTRAGAGMVLGLAGEVGAVPALWRRVALPADARWALRAIERMGGAAAAAALEAAADETVQRTDPTVARCLEILTMLAEERTE